MHTLRGRGADMKAVSQRGEHSIFPWPPLCLQASQTSCIADPAVTGNPPAFDLDLCPSL